MTNCATTIGNTTFFSTREFAEAWSRSFPGEYEPLAIPVAGSGPPRTIYSLCAPARFGSRTVPLTRYDFFLSPGWRDVLEEGTVKNVVDRLAGLRTRSFVWNVRFDHEPLADRLSALGFGAARIPTRVIRLPKDYETAFANFSATIRNKVRKGARRGLIVRMTNEERDITAYDTIYRNVAQAKGWASVYPLRFSLELVKLDVARFVVAEYEDRVVAGGLFVRDGDQAVYYLHAAQDAAYSHVSPHVAVLDHAIRWTCESAVPMFNLGMSGGIESLDKFKSFWGAEIAHNWSFEWHNPLWRTLGALKTSVSRRTSAVER